MKFLNLKENISKNRKIFLIHLIIPILGAILSSSIFLVVHGNFKNLTFNFYVSLLFSTLTSLLAFCVKIFYILLPYSVKIFFNSYYLFFVVLIFILLRLFVLYLFFYLDIRYMKKKYILSILDILIAFLIILKLTTLAI